MTYSFDEKILIWLSSFDFMTPSKAHTLLEYFSTPTKVFDAIKHKNEIANKILSNHFFDVFEKAEEKYLDTYIKNLSEQNIICSTYVSKTYPKKLKETFHAPINLYLLGDVSLLKTDSVAIVGTRNPSNYGKSITHDFSKNLAKAALTIVSGLAMGVDRIAHMATLEAGGKTIAVLGSGFNKIYPAMNVNLAKEIKEKGLLVSEYAPNINSTKYQFPQRNRIIAGLCRGVLLTEAGEKSGALYTKEYAIDFNRNVYVVPANITNVNSKGTNNLIKNFQGICVLGYEDILKDLNIDYSQSKNNYQLGVNESLILSYCEKGETHFDELLKKTNLEAKILNSCLTTMAIRGIIKKLPGNFYSN